VDLVGFLYGFGALQGLILACILLVIRSGHRFANVIMAVLVMNLALVVLQKMLVHMGFWLEAPSLALTLYPLRYSWGPLLYLYVFSLTGGQLHIRQLLHFLPAVLLFLVLNISVWQLTSLQQHDLVSYIWSLRNDLAQKAAIQEFLPIGGLIADIRAVSLVFTLQFSSYCLLLLAQLRRHNQRLQQHFSSLEHMTLRWLRMLTISCLVYLGLYIVFNRIPMITGNQLDRTGVPANMHTYFLVLLIYGIGIKALFQPSLISGVLQASGSELNQSDPNLNSSPITELSTTDETASVPLESAEPASRAGLETETETETESETESESDTAAIGKYERSGLSMEAAQRHQIALMEIMQEKKLYLDGDLALPGLAEAAGLTTHQVSQIINGQMNQNFFSFVNNYRIQLAKSMLLDPKTSSMPIVELALEVGFQSKSSFYEAFKRVTDMTPTQFKKSGVDVGTS